MSEEAGPPRPPKQVPIQKIANYTYQIPQTYKPGMHVPGIIYADDQLLEKMKTDATLEQCANVACLPGIYKASITLPDGHEGYGFPIGGVAAFDYEQGVISPGGVGYDINCLSADTRILTEHGYWMEIKDLQNMDRKIISVDLKDHRTVNTRIVRYIKIQPKNKVYKVVTETGKDIIATEDHPFLTPRGMIPLKDLVEGDYVMIYSFEGVRYEKPSDKPILTRAHVEAILPRIKEASIKELMKRNLLPLQMNSPATPILASLMGYVFGDGTIYFTKGKGVTCFFGKPEDLEEIREDIKNLGYTPSKIYQRTREHKITSQYGTKTFTTSSYEIKVVSTSFAALLAALGAPVGDKTKAAFRVPNWLKEAPLWIKRLFLASLFGAELTTPKKVRNFNFYCPVLTVNKTEDALQSGQNYLEDIAHLLSDFGIRTTKISKREEFKNKDGRKTIRLRLLISSQPDNLIKLWGQVGFKYNRTRTFLAGVALHYLKLKEKVRKARLEAAEKAKKLKRPGEAPSKIFEALTSKWINERFLERWVYRQDSPIPRIPQNFPTFENFIQTHAANPHNSPLVWDKIEKKQLIHFDNPVYDFTVEFKDHNFIANNFVVSNCGVRLLRTNLTEKDVRPKLPQILESLFHNIPSGLGSKGKIRLTPTELDKILANGVDWAIQNGYGWPEDAEHCEEKGHMPQADPTKVSTNAKSRGMPQTGSLGSGNHFLEIDVVDKIFDPQIAKQIGIIAPGQIMILIHTGSRGLGHQVCSDYLRIMEHAVHKYKIQIPDRELACAPGTSPEAQDYYAAMAAACNYAWANRQMITHWTRQTFQQIYHTDPENLDLHLIYDVAHNIAKIETHKINGKPTKVYCHRKGATRAFCAGHPDIPKDHRSFGQIVLIPGTMGTSSWVMVGTPRAMEISFGSTAHGAGRFMSRTAATKKFWGADVKKRLEQHGILIRAASMAVIAEESPESYKDVDAVAEVSHQVGIAMKVARLVPIGVTKG
ncbi:MAG: intein-containing RctB family protein [Candidatus Bathyarchaeia archaeon]